MYPLSQPLPPLSFTAGSSLDTRRAAADQIAAIVAAHPPQLPSVLAQVTPHLRSKEWDARIAAGHCLGKIAQHVAHPTPADLLQVATTSSTATVVVTTTSKGEEEEEEKQPQWTQHQLLSFETFDLTTVISEGTHLVASAGNEYDLPQGSNRTDSLSEQRNNLKKRLGLSGTAGEFINTADFLRDEDFLMPAATDATDVKDEVAIKEEKCEEETHHKREATELLAGMSARERAAAARRAKAAKKRGLVGGTDDNESMPKANKKSKLGTTTTATINNRGEESSATAAATTTMADNDIDAMNADALETQWQSIVTQGLWPFQPLCDQLLIDILNPAWEVRHGAALALREILTHQATCAAVIAPLDTKDGDLSGWIAAGGSGLPTLSPTACTAAVANQALQSNASWLEDCAIHLLCTLALDRFGDYVSDQVVAPVRETAAQAVGTVTRALNRPTLLKVMASLRVLTEGKEWEACHGGLLGLKYTLAAQATVDQGVLETALPACIVGLQHRDDDVRAVAAEAMLPAASLLAATTSVDDAGLRLLLLVWDVLLSTDELSPAIKGATSLLAAIYRASSSSSLSSEVQTETAISATAIYRNLADLFPRLWPHFRHNVSSVRLSSIRCFTAIIQAMPIPQLLPSEGGLCTALRLPFQNILLEQVPEIVEESEKAWRVLVHRCPPSILHTTVSSSSSSSSSLLSTLFSLAATPSHRRYDARLLVQFPKGGSGGQASAVGVPGGGGGDGEGEGQSARATRAKVGTATALGQLAHALDPHSSSHPGASNPLVEHIKMTLSNNASSSRLVAGLTLAKWAAAQQQQTPPPSLLTLIQQHAIPMLTVTNAIIFDELVSSYALLRRQVAGLSGMLPPTLPLPCAPDAITPDLALALAAQVVGVVNEENVRVAAQTVQTTASVLQTREAVAKTSVAAALAAAVVYSKQLPAKLNSVIQPLIASVRREPEELLQEEAAKALAALAVATAPRTPSPTEKIVKNVCVFACGDPEAVPAASSPPVLGEDEVLEAQQTGGGAQQAKKDKEQQQQVVEGAAQAAALTRRGGESMLRALTRACGPSLPTLVPGFWTNLITAAITNAATNPQAAVEGLRIIQVIAPALHSDVVPTVLTSLLVPIASCLSYDNGAVQLSAARALASLGNSHPLALMAPILDALTPLLHVGAADASRLGATVTMREFVNVLGIGMVPYVQLAVVPLLGRMSDPHPRVRAVASSCFAKVVALMPLALGVLPPPGLSAAQEKMLSEEGQFLQKLLDNKQMDDFELPFKLLTGQLRRYQQEGINWLAFLRRFGLHGVLADDMGLGKTLQATSIVAAASAEAKQRHRPLPSLIVCPATLVAHWPHEINKFVDESVLRPLQYHGTPGVRLALRPLVSTHDVVVISYEALRADVEWVSSIQWLYCVLDEGHAIRNPGSKIAQAARRVQAQHRLILSGTPIQNSVIEMWALFEFLMPGFLGTERAFNARYGKALAASRSAKKGSSEAEAGVLALDSLHKQVMPFVLRRTKDQVLKDLPPKIVQDIICEPSDLQRILYEDFTASQAMAAMVGAMQQGGGAGPGTTQDAASSSPHIFQALHYLRRLCSHPLFVLDPDIPAHSKALATVLGPGISHGWEEAKERIKLSLEHSPKLAALRELLLDSGIGTEETGDKETKEEEMAAADAGHRVLVFAQTKAMLDVAEEAVLRPLGISSLRIDGTVDAAERFRRVQKFNVDPTVEVMLLTTAVGGLGLNLTAADTVIILEHDWNPQKDLQAMDRAHRLGQRRSVNVYRLLVRGTLEEQVMSLQKFKLDVASAVVNAENMSLTNMDTGNLLDLFALQEGGAQGKNKVVNGEGGGAAGTAAAVGGGAARKGLAAMLAELSDPDKVQAEYEEFDLDQFKEKLGKSHKE